MEISCVGSVCYCAEEICSAGRAFRRVGFMSLFESVVLGSEDTGPLTELMSCCVLIKSGPGELVIYRVQFWKHSQQMRRLHIEQSVIT